MQHLKAAAAASIAQHAINISAAREQLGKGMQCSSMKQQQRELEEQAAQLQLTCTAERQQARRFQELMGSHVQEHGSKGRLLAEMLAAVRAIRLMGTQGGHPGKGGAAGRFMGASWAPGCGIFQGACKDIKGPPLPWPSASAAANSLCCC